VVGFHGRDTHIPYGMFPADTMTRVHSKGCSKNEVFDLKFTRGYNLCSKADWLGATRALSRLLRYLLSGNAKVCAVQTYLRRGTES
jgi:hypothetical protein